jgi:hypothetical protein
MVKGRKSCSRTQSVWWATTGADAGRGKRTSRSVMRTRSGQALTIAGGSGGTAQDSVASREDARRLAPRRPTGRLGRTHPPHRRRPAPLPGLPVRVPWERTWLSSDGSKVEDECEYDFRFELAVGRSPTVCCGPAVPSHRRTSGNRTWLIQAVGWENAACDASEPTA